MPIRRRGQAPALQGCVIRCPPHSDLCRTVATGGRTAWCQRLPRAGTFAPGFRTKLSRKWGAGGGQHWRPIRADVATPGDLFAPFGSLQKGLAAGAAKCPPNQTVRHKTGGRGKPLPYGRIRKQGKLLRAARQGCRALRSCITRHQPHYDPSLRGGQQARRGNPFSCQKGDGFPRPLRGLGLTVGCTKYACGRRAQWSRPTIP